MMKHTATAPLDWFVMMGLAQRLRNDELFSDYLLLICGSYFGLRIGDLLKLKYSMLIGKDEFAITEQKTKKVRRITIHPQVKEALVHATSVLQRQGKYEFDSYLFANRWGFPVTVSYVNKRLKYIFTKYRVRVQKPSSHTLRKTFGRRIWELDGKSDRALIYLSELFSHTTTATTRRYLGITQQTLQNLYLSL